MLKLFVLHNKINTSKTTEERENIIKIIKSSSIMMWSYVNFRGLYDFSEEMISDQFGLKLDRSKPLQAIEVLLYIYYSALL